MRLCPLYHIITDGPSVMTRVPQPAVWSDGVPTATLVPISLGTAPLLALLLGSGCWMIKAGLAQSVAHLVIQKQLPQADGSQGTWNFSVFLVGAYFCR